MQLTRSNGTEVCRAGHAPCIPIPDSAKIEEPMMKNKTLNHRNLKIYADSGTGAEHNAPE